MRKEILSIDYGFAMEDFNKLNQGISTSEFKARIDLCSRKNRELFLERVAGMAGFYSLPYFEKEARKILRFTSNLKKRFDTLVVLGVGGSALGTSGVVDSLMDRLSRRSGKVLVLDNIDPDKFSYSLSQLDPGRTIFNVISKSGETWETLSQFFILASLLKKKLGKTWKEHVIITTDPERGLLRDLVEKYGFLSFPVPSTVGGRFSIFSPVGLLPLAFSGVDVNSLLEGARFIDGMSLGTKGEANPVIVLSAIYSYFMMEEKKSVFVLFSYSDFFGKLGEWFCQLWAESLGKERVRGKKIENVGQTPVGVTGVAAQYSQLQLYAEGPDDKIFTFIGPGKFNKDFTIRPPVKDGRVEFLYNSKLSDLLRADMEATICSIASKGRPLVLIEPFERNEFTIGALLFLFECVTALTGKMLGINPFDQPGLEHGRKLTKAVLGGDRDSEQREELEEVKKIRGKCEITLEVHWKE